MRTVAPDNRRTQSIVDKMSVFLSRSTSVLLRRPSAGNCVELFPAVIELPAKGQSIRRAKAMRDKEMLAEIEDWACSWPHPRNQDSLSAFGFRANEPTAHKRYAHYILTQGASGGHWPPGGLH
jgi:hypothetical protein